MQIRDIENVMLDTGLSGYNNTELLTQSYENRLLESSYISYHFRKFKRWILQKLC